MIGVGSLIASTLLPTGGAVAVVSAVSYGVVDQAGGGKRIVVSVDSSTGCTAIKAGGVAFTSFAIDDATHVSGIPGAHVAGVVDVVVTNATGDSTTGTGLIEYWSAKQVTGAAGVFDADKNTTIATGVSAWSDQSTAGLDLAQATGAKQPALTPSAFGTIHGLTLTGAEVLALAAAHVQATGRSLFWVAKYTATTSTHVGYAGDCPLTVVGDNTGGINVSAGLNAGSLSYQNFAGGWTETVRGSSLNDGVARLMGWTHDTSGNLKAYVGATQQGATVTGQTYNVSTSEWNVIGQGIVNDGFVGTLGAVVIVDGIISGADLIKLNAWAQQRFGTP